MSFWDLLCKAAILDMVCRLFSSKPRQQPLPSQPIHSDSYCDMEIENRIKELENEIKESEKRIAEYQAIIDNGQSGDLDDCDIDELQDRIDELESRLDDCDEMSDRYDYIQDEIDLLQDRLDAMSEWEDTYDDLHFYDNDIACDDEW